MPGDTFFHHPRNSRRHIPKDWLTSHFSTRMNKIILTLSAAVSVLVATTAPAAIIMTLDTTASGPLSSGRSQSSSGSDPAGYQHQLSDSVSRAEGTGSATAQGRVLAAHGVLRGEAYTAASVAASPAIGGSVWPARASVTGQAGWSDTVVVTSSGVAAGQTGYFTGLLRVDGSVHTEMGTYGPGDFPAANAYARLSGTGLSAPADLSLVHPALRSYATGGYFSASQSGFFGSEPGWNSAGYYTFSAEMPPAGMISVTIPFVFGSNTGLNYSLQIGATAAPVTSGNGTGTSGLATVAYGHTVSWGGIMGVFLSDGTPVTGWTTTSGSGLDYAVATIPEPGIAPLTAAAAIVLLRRRRAKSFA